MSSDNEHFRGSSYHYETGSYIKDNYVANINVKNNYVKDTNYSDYPKKQPSSLLGLIIHDLLRNQKISILLLILIIISAVAVLVTTQQVRKQLIEREQLILEQDVLESEWRNLVIEENVLADPKRIEDKARNQLGMTNVTPQNETVIVIKNSLIKSNDLKSK
ncbi:cell division protein FtsL [Orbaceae bacterium ESL0721]|nr:cell division protein FtsL [Orbaceae bacterium ESL0721]